MIPAVTLQDLDDVGALRVGERPLRAKARRRPESKPGTDMRRQVAGLDRLVACEDCQPLHRVLELAHVAGPGIPEEPLRGTGAQAEDAALAPGEARQKVLGQQRDVLAPLPE